MKAILQFSGFYHSIHSDILDSQIERDLEEFYINPTQCEQIWADIDYTKAYKEYAKALVSEMPGDYLTFEALHSPREYNFTTDTIEVSLSMESLRAVYSVVMRDGKQYFIDLCKDYFTSRSGFVSFYDPDFITWGNLASWDENQIGVLIETFNGLQDFDDSSNDMYEIMNETAHNIMNDAMGKNARDRMNAAIN